jgi:hypothetical protein
MKRWAAHYVLLPDNRLLKRHYIETDDKGRLCGVFPLDGEIANTVFYSGILMPVDRSGETEIYLLERIDLLPAKFGADDCRRHRHIQRIG